MNNTNRNINNIENNEINNEVNNEVNNEEKKEDNIELKNINYYNIGKNFILSCENFNIIDLEYINNIDFIDFFRGYIELNSKILIPNNNSQDITETKLYKKNKQLIKHTHNKQIQYPLFLICFKKSDKKLLDIFINYINQNSNIQYSIIIQNFTYNKIKYNYKLQFETYNVLNILSKLYYPNIDKNDTDEYLYNIYMTLSNYKYINYDSDNDSLTYLLPKCNIKLLNSSAKMPFKENASDVGYEITIIKRFKTISDKITLYDTGIQLIPQFGYYFELIPTFNLSLTGYIIANSVGVINPVINNNKSLLVSLIKIDKSMPDIILPFTCCKIILKEMIHFELNLEK